MSMKRYISALLVMLMASFACNVGIPNVVRGSGNIITETFEVSGFDQVELSTVGEVHLEQGDTESVTVETDDNIMPVLVVKVDGSKLTLSSKVNSNIDPSALTFTVTVKELSHVIANSSGDIFTGPIKGDSLDVLANASGNVNLESVEVNNFSVTAGGSGNITVDNVEVESVHSDARASGAIQIAGTATSHTVEVGGSGEIDAGDLQTSTAEVTVKASGDVTVWVSDRLDVSIHASGNVKYYGDPTVTQNISGSGNLTSLGEK
jgi:putative autotransporter adhesin-like protein